ncbi:hypothetical protein MASR2M78_26400 [Treponema sp.]
MRADNKIGTKKESLLHSSLKYHYAGEDGTTESSVGNYVCDAIRSDGLIIEIQTGSFKPLLGKAGVLTEQGPLKIVHPIAQKRIIEVRDTEGQLLRQRISPKKGRAWDLFSALVYAAELPLIPRLSIELALTEEVELRIDDGKGSWRRKGLSIRGRTLTSILETIHLSSPADYQRFVPFAKNEAFGVKELAEKAKINRTLAQKTVYVLARIGLLREIAKKGKAKQYALK